MEKVLEKPYLGRINNKSVFINRGKFGPYLNYDGKLYSIAQCFQDDQFNINTAKKIIDYKNKKEKKNQIKNNNNELLSNLTTAAL